MNYAILNTELALPAYSGLGDQAIVDSLNAQTIPAGQAIATSDIKKYLMTAGVWLAIKDSASDAARLAMDALTLFEEFSTEPAVEQTLIAILDALMAESLIPAFTATNKSDILAMGDTLISRAEQLGLPVVTLRDIQEVQ